MRPTGRRHRKGDAIGWNHIMTHLQHPAPPSSSSSSSDKNWISSGFVATGVVNTSPGARMGAYSANGAGDGDVRTGCRTSS